MPGLIYLLHDSHAKGQILAACRVWRVSSILHGVAMARVQPDTDIALFFESLAAEGRASC